MSDLDKYILDIYDSDKDGRLTGSESNSYLRDTWGSGQSPRDIAIRHAIDNFSVTDITSRDQIVNPESFLSGFDFSNTENDRAIYNEYLASLRNIQTQQTAAFEEWYNSTEQQVLRDKAAGLNPDILGVQGTQAGQAGVLEGSPYDGLMTQEQIDMQRMNARTQRIQSFVSFISSLASVASLPAQFITAFAGANVAKEQADSLHLGNIKSFEDLVSNEISSRLSDAVSSAVDSGQSLDIASWFGDENNFAGLLDYSPDGSVPYQNSLAKVRNRMQRSLSAAYDQGAVTADNRRSFASLIADPRYSSDIILQAAFLRPYVSAQVAREKAFNDFETTLYNWNNEFTSGKDVTKFINEANNQAGYNAEYYDELKATLIAAAQNYKAENESIRYQFDTSVQRNYMDIYNRDPNDMSGIAALYMSRADFSGTFGLLNAGIGGIVAGPINDLDVFLTDLINNDDSFLEDLKKSLDNNKLGQFLHNRYREYLESFKNPDSMSLTD